MAFITDNAFIGGPASAVFTRAVLFVLNTSFLSWIDPSDQAETLLNIVRAKSNQQIDNFSLRHICLKTSSRVRVLINAVYQQKEAAEYYVIYAFPLPLKLFG